MKIRSAERNVLSLHLARGRRTHKQFDPCERHGNWALPCFKRTKLAWLPDTAAIKLSGQRVSPCKAESKPCYEREFPDPNESHWPKARKLSSSSIEDHGIQLSLTLPSSRIEGQSRESSPVRVSAAARGLPARDQRPRKRKPEGQRKERNAKAHRLKAQDSTKVP